VSAVGSESEGQADDGVYVVTMATIECGLLSAGAGGMWVEAGVGTTEVLPGTVGFGEAARASCVTRCAALNSEGVCLYKGGWGGVCWFQHQGVEQDYEARHGWTDTRHYTSVCKRGTGEPVKVLCDMQTEGGGR
jgi:hypothetical protein